jgi:hypothetical protein
MYAAANGTVPVLIHLCLVKVVLVRNYLHIQRTAKFRGTCHVHCTMPPDLARAKSTPKNEEEKQLQKKKRLAVDRGGWRLRTSNIWRATAPQSRTRGRRVRPLSATPPLATGGHHASLLPRAKREEAELSVR